MISVKHGSARKIARTVRASHLVFYSSDIYDVDMNGKHKKRATRVLLAVQIVILERGYRGIALLDSRNRINKNSQGQDTRSRPIKIQNLWVRCYKAKYVHDSLSLFLTLCENL